MNEIFSLWMTGKYIKLHCIYCGTYNTFPNGKCVNCGGKVNAIINKEQVYLEQPYFVRGGVSVRGKTTDWF